MSLLHQEIITNNNHIRSHYSPKQIKQFLNRNKLSKKSIKRWKWNIIYILYGIALVFATLTAVETLSAPTREVQYSSVDKIATIELLEEPKPVIIPVKTKTIVREAKKPVVPQKRTSQTDIQKQVQAIASEYGWGNGEQWEALSWIIQKESSWNINAQNKKSTAFSLFQFLDQTWKSYGCVKNNDVENVTRCGIKYIQKRYGTPTNAKAFHLKNNWY